MRIALVTGAGSGIGRAVSVGMLRAGYAVVLAGRRAEALRETVAQAGAAADRALVVPTDVTDHEAVGTLFAAVRDRFGRLDVLFNNAGISAPAVPIDEVTLEQWRAVLDVNLTAVFLCTQQAVRLMKLQRPRGGRIINNGSLAAHVPRPHASPYAATKHALTGLTRATALEGRAFDIACGQIDIGNAATDMARGYTGGALQPDGTVAPEALLAIEHVVEGVLYMAGLPLGANVPFLTVMATTMPYHGRG